MVEDTVQRQPITINRQNPALIVLSAKTQERLKVLAQQLVTYIDEQHLCDADMADMAYTLQVGREAPSPVSEDFSLFSSMAPGAYFLVGAALDDGRPMRFAHNAEFDLDERFLPIAAAILAEIARQYLLSQLPKVTGRL